ncbi:MAG: class I SAM-dependent methyltransferase [Candidatus Hodarchaeota archaeon]
MNLKQVKETLGEEFSRDADFLGLLVEQLNLARDSRVLDVGTGRGHMAIILALYGYNVITGEPEGTFWADWETSAKKASVEDMITFTPLNAENLPFMDNDFDAIFLYATFHHIGNKERAFDELMRVLKYKGILAIIELTEEGVEVVRQRFRGHPDAVDPRDYIKDIDLGVKVIESKYLNAYIYKKTRMIN